VDAKRCEARTLPSAVKALKNKQNVITADHADGADANVHLLATPPEGYVNEHGMGRTPGNSGKTELIHNSTPIDNPQLPDEALADPDDDDADEDDSIEVDPEIGPAPEEPARPMAKGRNSE
jgi:hypothetical protein